MSIQTLTMSNSLPRSARQANFIRRLILLALFTAAIVFWMSLLFRYQTRVSQELMIAFADIAIALAASLGARFLFYQRNFFVRFISATAVLILGLLALGYITNWKMGIGPLEFWRESIEWFEVAQVGGGLLVVLLGLKAWWRPASYIAEPVERSPRSISNERQPTASFQSPHLRDAENLISSSNGRARLKLKQQTRPRREKRKREPEKVVISYPIIPARSKQRRKLFQRKPDVKMSVFEEHRCPYCLDDVKRNDPRGTKECEVCHSLHHADCWAITGMCQVPHLNS